MQRDRTDGRLERGRCRRLCDLFRLVEELEHALRGGDGRLQHVDDAGGLDDREGELARVLDEGDHVSQRHLTGCHAQAADDRDRDVIEVGDEAHRRLDDSGDELRSVARLVELLVLGIEHLDRLALASERLDDGVPGVHLLDVPVERAGRRPLDDELLLRSPHDEDRHDERARHGQDRDQGQDRADRHHQDQHEDDRQQRGDELRQALLQRLADVVDVVGDATQQVAARVAVEVAQRQPAELFVDLRSQPVDRPLGDAGHDVCLQPGEDRADDVHDDEQHEDPGQRGEVDACAGRQRHGRQHVGELVLALGTQARDRLVLGDAGGQGQAGGARDDHVDRLALDLGPDDGKGDADDGQREDEQDQQSIRPQVAEQSAQRAAEVLRLRSGQGHAHAHHSRAA